MIHPYRLVNFMELLEVCVEPYWRLGALIGQATFRLAYSEQNSVPPPEGFAESLGSIVREVEREATKLDLKPPLQHIKRMKEHWAAPGTVAWGVFKHQFEELLTRVLDELSSKFFLSLPAEVVDYYRQETPLFGESVEKHFPEMTEDISEAGKCLALCRGTACVFHLMRAMELAVQRFGEKTGVKLASEQNWQVILDQINKAIRAMDPDKPRTKALAQAASHLYNVKVSWRNEVMHPKQTYTFEEAKTIFANVRTFIGDLAEVL